MMETPVLKLRQPLTPADMPGLVCFWDCQDGGDTLIASAGEAYTLTAMADPLRAVDDAEAPWGARAIELEEGQWLQAARAAVPRLDFHGPAGHFTLVAWIRRARKSKRQCEFIAGQWNETHRSRQYGLFLNIGVWNSSDQICGHVSRTGAATDGWKFCTDGAIGATAVPWDEWHSVAMSYDGTQAWAWLDGRPDLRPILNPYLIPGGLNDGGPNGSDFTVGAVDRSGEIGNFFAGRIGGLAVYDRCLTPAEMYALAAP